MVMTAVAGNAFTVNVVVVVALEHPPVPKTVYVIVTAPAVRPVANPEAELMVAMAVLELLHVPPLTVEERVVVDPIQIEVPPDNVPAFGVAVTVMLLFAVAFAHPPVPTTVYVMVEDPADSGVITPEVELIVATVVLLLLHVPPPTVEVRVDD
jgi:hypothetical protein